MTQAALDTSPRVEVGRTWSAFRGDRVIRLECMIYKVGMTSVNLTVASPNDGENCQNIPLIFNASQNEWIALTEALMGGPSEHKERW